MLLLIAPLWNWNSLRKQKFDLSCQPFNRTFMELKHVEIMYLDENKTATFNRTFMELKLQNLSSLLFW